MPRALAPFLLLALTAVLMAPALAARTMENVELRIPRSLGEIREYVDDVDRRLQKGRYDVVEQKDREWIVESIAAVRAELDKAGSVSTPGTRLIEVAGDFEAGMIRIEEGGIRCRRERRTGTRMPTLRCFSAKRQQEDIDKSQQQFREMFRPAAMPTAAGAGQ